MLKLEITANYCTTSTIRTIIRYITISLGFPSLKLISTAAVAAIVIRRSAVGQWEAEAEGPTPKVGYMRVGFHSLQSFAFRLHN